MTCRLFRHQSITRTNADLMAHGSKPKWNLIQNTKTFIEENAFENVVCKMSTILFPGQ